MKFGHAAFCMLLLSVGALPAHAQMDHSKMGHAMAPAKSESDKEFAAAMTKMHKDMAIKYSGNADVDFVRGMIPHHQGAIDMAKTELKYGKDETIRKLAEDVVKAQEAEIAMMKDWLAKNAK